MKRGLLFVMALVCVAGVFASGGSEAADSGMDGVTVNRTGYPIVSEPVTYDVTAVQAAWGRNWGEMPMFEAYEELTGIQINWTMIPDSEHIEKTNLMLATASYPDVYMGGAGLGPKTDETIQGGVIMPLNDLLDEWAPNIQAFFAEVPEIKAAATYPDGEIYGFPSYNNESYHLMVSTKWYVVLDWLNALGLDMPTTTGEFYEMLKAFKEGDPNGNGIADEIPLAFNTSNQGEIAGWITYFGPWGVVDTVMVEDGDVYWGFQDEGFREATKFFRRLAEEGLLDKESIVQTQDQRRARAIVDGDVVLGVGPSLAPQFVWNDMSIVFKYDDTYRTLDTMDQLLPNPNRMIGVIPPFAGPDGDNLWRLQTGVNMAFGKGYIFNDCPMPEAMVRWFDHWYDGDRNGFTMHNGPEGIRWEQNPETGAFIEYMPPEELGMNLQEWRSWHTPINTYYWDREAEIRKPVLPRHIMLEEYTDQYLPYIPEESFPVNLVKAVDEEIDILAQYEEELLSYVWETMAQFIFGDVDIDAEWPRFLAQTDRMRADEILAVKQAQYDRYVEALNN
jgi:putative aldouronate transport system substrate-binding protein